jgi:uncharacterized protein YcsI (UPF0317 family)
LRAVVGRSQEVPVNIEGLAEMSPGELRALARGGRLTGPTCGLAPGYLQANFVAVPGDAAADFRAFCETNPQPCPLLEVSAAGETGLRTLAAGVDLRTDLPRYRVFRAGEAVAEPTDLREFWRDDLVSFLLGCSFSFEEAMLEAGLPVRHIEEGVNVPMYRTNIACGSAGSFAGNMVVSMRPLSRDLVGRARELCSHFRFAHGVPVHAGDPGAIGIAELGRPDFGDPVTVRAGEIPVFWACGVTPQEALRSAKLDLAVTHSPGCMFVSDLTTEDWRKLECRAG